MACSTSSSSALLLLLLSLASTILQAHAQDGGWQVDNQVSASMCQWVEPRVAVIRDTVYLDGGYLWWQAGLADGTIGSPSQDGNRLGILYTLNFSTPFNTSTNTSSILGRISKVGGNGAANNVAPNYVDGAMFANDGEFFTYGGLTPLTDAFVPQSADAVLAYQAYWYGAEGKRFTPGFVQALLPQGLTRYITAGAYVSVPSENLGFYFSGLTSAVKGLINYSGNKSTSADVVSNTLISIDMTTQTKETWSNQTLPTTVPGRANPEIVWLPVSKQGILIAIGGVLHAQFAAFGSVLNATEMAQDQHDDLGYMTTVSIYDIATQTWYNQATTGDSPQGLTRGCTVVATSQDGSSHNIYWYGGFDGIDVQKPLSDDVYVLSVPSFTWIKLYDGTRTPTHGRAGHKCVKPYPDQMLVIGGYPQSGTEPTCVEGGLIQIFNLSAGTWMASYDPAVWSNYSVPSAVVAKIGGDGAGGAPSPTTFTNQSLAAVFKTTYSTKITSWYPYSSVAPAGPNSRPPANPTPTPLPSGGGGLPSWVAPVLGVVLGLVGISAILVCILLWRRRKYLRQGGSVTGTSDLNRYRIMSWVRGADPGGKATTVTSDETPQSPSEEVESPVMSDHNLVEVQDTQLHEMPDTSQPQELSAAGMSYVRPSTNVLYPGLKSHGTHASHASTSTYSDFSDDTVSSQGPGSPIVHRADSPSLGSDPRAKFVSGVSAASSDYRGFASASDDEIAGGKPTALPSPEERDETDAAMGIMSPVSPPTPHGQEAQDYMSKPTSSTPSGHRKSNFGEMLDES